MSSQTSPGTTTVSETEAKAKTEIPSLYRVILLNDDFTPMDFVVHVLKAFFDKTDVESVEIMLSVHHKGFGIAGVYQFDIAETKVFQVNQYARKNEHPLKCVLEKDV